MRRTQLAVAGIETEEGGHEPMNWEVFEAEIGPPFIASNWLCNLKELNSANNPNDLKNRFFPIHDSRRECSLASILIVVL